MRSSRLTNIGLGVLAVGAMVLGVVSAANAARPPIGGGGGGTTYCPDVWAPVICSNGVTYSNQCYADKAKAKGCRPANES